MNNSMSNIAEDISVLLVDDHEIWRGGVRSMLEDTEFHIIDEASSGREALESARREFPRLCLMDIRMAGGDGLDALVAMKKEFPKIIFVMLTTYDNPTYMARAVAGGAAGYLLKGSSQREILKSLRSVVKGEILISSQELMRSLRIVSDTAAVSHDLIEPLTNREQEVLRLLSTGLSNKEIGSLLFVAECTIKTHVEHIISKLVVSDRVQAAVWAARYGLVPVSK